MRSLVIRLSPLVPIALPLAALSMVVVAAGCRFGEAHFDSSVADRTFDPAGTVFSYLDEHDDQLVQDANPRVVVAMTWVIFDPNGDLNDLEGSALADYAHELELRDAVSLVFDEQGDLRADAEFTSKTVGTETAPGALIAKLHLAPERLNAASTYGDVIPLASDRTTTVKITNDPFEEAAPAVAGEISITFTRTAEDPGDAREGAFTGTFRAPVASERSAEQNLALLDVSDVLGLPLLPRSVE